jgi:hypothetical protein
VYRTCPDTYICLHIRGSFRGSSNWHLPLSFCLLLGSASRFNTMPAVLQAALMESLWIRRLHIQRDKIALREQCTYIRELRKELRIAKRTRFRRWTTKLRQCIKFALTDLLEMKECLRSSVGDLESLHRRLC